MAYERSAAPFMPSMMANSASMIGKQDACTQMSGAEFRARLRELGRSHAGFAREIGASPRSVDRWLADRPPPEVVYIVDLLTTLELHVAPREALTDADHVPVDIEGELDSMMRRARAWQQEAKFLEAIRQWLATAQP